MASKKSNLTVEGFEKRLIIIGVNALSISYKFVNSGNILTKKVYSNHFKELLTDSKFKTVNCKQAANNLISKIN